MLKSLSRQKTNDFSTLDIETDKEGNTLDIAIYDGSEVRFFPTWSAFFDFLLTNNNHKRFCKFIAHGGGVFDYVSMVSELDHLPEGITVEIITALSDIIMITFKGLKNRVLFVDSGKVLVGASLDKLSKLFDIKDKKIKIEHYDMAKFKTEKPHEYYAYLSNDVKGLYQICRKFMDVLDIKFFPVTIASLSLYLFKHEYIGEYELWKPGKVDDSFLSASYAGGRVEVFKGGKHDVVYAYDINSMYPFAMYNLPIPLGLPLVTRRYNEGKPGFYEIEFDQDDKSIPPLLWSKTSNGLEFSYYGRGVFSNYEVEKFFEIGGKVKIFHGLTWSNSACIFNDFVADFYQKKNSSSNHLKFIYKLILNSLYGKFGQREETEKLLRIPEGVKYSELLEKFKDITPYYDNWVIVKQSRKVSHRLVYISSLITSRARCILYDYLLIYKDSLIYCDTDSLHLSRQIPSEFLGQGLGELRLERSGEGIYLGRKQYHLDGVSKFKGVATADNLTGSRLERSDYEKMLEKTVDYTYAKFPKVRSVLSGVKPCKMRTIAKQLTGSEYLSNYQGG